MSKAWWKYWTSYGIFKSIKYNENVTWIRLGTSQKQYQQHQRTDLVNEQEEPGSQFKLQQEERNEHYKF